MKIIKRLFCLHRWEYEKDINGDLIKVCSKCDKVKNL